MKPDSNRFSAVVVCAVGILGLGQAPAMAAAGPESASPAPIAAHASIDLTSQIAEWLETIYRLLGGDPNLIRVETTVVGKMGLVAALYATAGVPDDLSPEEEALLIADVDALYAALNTPSPGLALLHKDSFMRILSMMWAELGMPQGELGQHIQ